jgi:hypothetical protein
MSSLKKYSSTVGGSSSKNFEVLLGCMQVRAFLKIAATIYICQHCLGQSLDFF